MWLGRAARVVPLALLQGGCAAVHRGFLSPAGPVASATLREFLFVCLVMLFVIGPVLLLVPLVAWHYRLSNTRTRLPAAMGRSAGRLRA